MVSGTDYGAKLGFFFHPREKVGRKTPAPLLRAEIRAKLGTMLVFRGPRPLGACLVCLRSIDRRLHVNVNRGGGTYMMCKLPGMR